MQFLPAPAGHGITLTRTDCATRVDIPARVEFTAPRARRTALELRGVAIELVEHVLAALAGLQIDNCRVLVHGPELPGLDGSSRAFVEVLVEAGIVDLGVPRERFAIPHPIEFNDGEAGMQVAPGDRLIIEYRLDYGPASPIPAQKLRLAIHPEAFLNELAYARTFVLESEVAALQAQGTGLHLSVHDLIVYGNQGVIGNELRAADECVRHKLLDCVGDFALMGCDLVGRIVATKTGHRHNALLIRELRRLQDEAACAGRSAA